MAKSFIAPKPSKLTQIFIVVLCVSLTFMAVKWALTTTQPMQQSIQEDALDLEDNFMVNKTINKIFSYYKSHNAVKNLQKVNKYSNNQQACPHIKADKHDEMLHPLCKDQGTVVVYSKLHDNFPAERFRKYKNDCKLPNGVTCLYTEDDSLYITADALYVHECFSFCEIPAYSEQIVIHYNLGPEVRPCNNKAIHSSDIRISYSTSSTIPFLYLCLPGIKQPVMDALQLEPPSNRRGIAMFVSDCDFKFSKWRYNYLKELMWHIEIDSYGKCLHNTVMNSTRQDTKAVNHYDLKIELLKGKRYKFLICFENTPVSEYITEKVWHAYISQTIPIYYGAPEIYRQAPGAHTFIDASKYAGPQQLAEYIKKVDTNEQLYQSFFNFNLAHLKAFERRWCSDIPLSCRMCRKAYEIKQKRCNTRNLYH